MFLHNCLCFCCYIVFLGIEEWSQDKERLIFWSQTEPGCTLGWISNPHPPSPNSTDQTAGWLITPPPLPSAHRWDVRLKVDGEQRGVWCYTPSYRLELRHQTAPLPPLPCCLMPFVSFRYPSTASDAIRHDGALLKTSLKMGGGSLLLWFWVIYEVLEYAYRAVALQCFCVRNIKVSKVVRAILSGQWCLTLIFNST